MRNLLPDNTVQGATLKPWTIGVTVTQTLFNGYKTANSVRVAELQVQSGREALRNVGQGVLLDAVTAYTNVLANQSLVEAQRSNVAFLRETLAITKRRLNAGDVTPVSYTHLDVYKRQVISQPVRRKTDADATGTNQFDATWIFCGKLLRCPVSVVCLLYTSRCV